MKAESSSYRWIWLVHGLFALPSLTLRRLILVMVLAVGAVVTQGASVGLLVPAAQLVENPNTADLPGPLGKVVNWTFTAIDLPYSIPVLFAGVFLMVIISQLFIYGRARVRQINCCECPVNYFRERNRGCKRVTELHRDFLTAGQARTLRRMGYYIELKYRVVNARQIWAAVPALLGFIRFGGAPHLIAYAVNKLRLYVSKTIKFPKGV